MFVKAYDSLPQDEAHYKEILRNDVMIEAWERLCDIEEKETMSKLSESYDPASPDTKNLELMQQPLQQLRSLKEFRRFLGYLKTNNPNHSL